MKVDESAYKADFEISQRYINFSAELLRISLLAIGAYLTLVLAVLKSPANVGIVTQSLLFPFSIALFGVCSGAALAQRYFATDSLSCQIRFLRLLNATQTTGGNTPGALSPAADAEKKVWIRQLKRAGGWLIVAEVCFLAAVLCLTGAILIFLYKTP